jgi:lipid-A-disaccharide synthase-like uncharacterized protein
LFSSAPQTGPLSSRIWGIGLGTIIVVGVPAMIVSAKTVQVTLPLLLVAALAGAVARGRMAIAKPSLDGISLSMLVFVVYAALSATWAQNPHASFLIVLMAGVVSLGTLILVALLRTEDQPDTLHMGEGLWIGLAVGVAYTVTEIASDQGIKIWAYNMLELGPDKLSPARYFTWESGRVVAVHPDDLTRNVVPVPLLLWPALMGASALPSRFWRIAVAGALIVLSGVGVLLATSESAKVALVAAMLAFVAGRYSDRLAHGVIAVAWTVACLAIVPLVNLARYLNLQDADWLQLSAQLRITIWSEIAQRVPSAPLFGVGANMTYHTEPLMHDVPSAVASWTNLPITHPHNIYLQVWYELGLVGALVFAIFGIQMLAAASRLSASQRPYAFAMFSALATQIGFSYNLWQIWFMCLFGFTAAMFTVGQRATAPIEEGAAR